MVIKHYVLNYNLVANYKQESSKSTVLKNHKLLWALVHI